MLISLLAPLMGLPTMHELSLLLVDHYGEESMLHFPRDGSFATLIFQNHGEAYNIMSLALRAHAIPADDNVAILHIDHHDDMQLPEAGFESMEPAQCDPDRESECPLHNDNQQLATVIKSAGAVNRTLWLYPAYKGTEWVTPPHVCVVGKNSHGRYSHRTIAGEWWGLEDAGQHVVPPGRGFVCGSTPYFAAPGGDEHDPTRPTREPLDAFERVATYEYAQASLADVGLRSASRDPAVVAVRDVLHGNSSWFLPGKAWVLDIDIDYLVERPETSVGNPSRTDVIRAIRIERTLDWLCDLTVQCSRIVSELDLEPPPKPEISQVEIADRVAGVEVVLRDLLPSRPCLVTIARSNQGAFTPLRWTMAMEDAVIAMLERLYGKQPTGVQYLRSAFGSHDASVATFERIERDRHMEMPGLSFLRSKVEL